MNCEESNPQHPFSDNTLNPANIDPKDISAVYYAGGHGPMWDVAFDKEIAELSRRVYVDFNGILGAICHGVCGLLPISLKHVRVQNENCIRNLI